MDPFTKKVRIARSGIYEYGAEELPSLGFDPYNIPEQFQGKSVILVYRPATTIAGGFELFNKKPLTYTHPVKDGVEVDITPDNFNKFGKGWTGDNSVVEYFENEAYIVNEVTLFEREALDAFERGEREVSPGYQAKYDLAPEGSDYDIIMTEIISVNHLAFVPKGRGGETVKILDHKRGRILKSGLIHNVKKMFFGTKDTDLGLFREVTNKIKQEKDVKKTGKLVTELYKIMEDLPNSSENERDCWIRI